MIKTLKDIWYALTSPEKYRDFMNFKRRNLLFHVFILVVVANMIIFGIPAAEFMSEGGFEVLLQEEIPEFTASSEDGFWIEEPVEIDEFNFILRADSSEVKEDITDLNGQYGVYDNVFVVDKEQIHISMSGVQEITARFDEMPGFSFTKADLMEYIPVMYMACVWSFLFLILMDIAYYFMVALIVSWMSGLIASFMRIRIPRKRLFRMAVYAGTLSYIVLFVQSVTGKAVPNYTFFSYVITLGYMFFAIKDLKEHALEELPPEAFGGREDNL